MSVKHMERSRGRYGGWHCISHRLRDMKRETKWRERTPLTRANSSTFDGRELCEEQKWTASK